MTNRFLKGFPLLAVLGVAAACASTGTSVQRLHTPKTHERKIFLKKKSAGSGCTVRDQLSQIKAHTVDDIIWRVKNDCDTGTHKVEIRIKTTSGDPLATCDRDVDVKDNWERIFCAINPQAVVNQSYYYSVYVDNAEEQDPEIEIYP